jgi:hypothetical protein
VVVGYSQVAFEGNVNFHTRANPSDLKYIVRFLYVFFADPRRGSFPDNALHTSPRCGFADLPPAVAGRSSPPRVVDGGDVDLFHFHHRLESALGFAAAVGKRVG